MFKANPTTDQIMRSLLQKAVRRGDLELTKKILLYLISIDDFTWVRKRLAVMTFEECWQYGLKVSYENDYQIIINHYLNLASTIKNKNSAGLGSLAYDYSESSSSFNYFDQELLCDIKQVAEAIKYPETFWENTLDTCEQNNLSERKITLITKAKESFKKVSWPWDKAFILAGAYLSLNEDIPKLAYPKIKIETPLWVGIDKHTGVGKAVLKKISYEMNINLQKLYAISFYFEGGLCNQMQDSFWWEKQIEWSLKSLNITMKQGQQLWGKIRIKLAKLLEEECFKIEEKLNSVKEVELKNTKQLGLF